MPKKTQLCFTATRKDGRATPQFRCVVECHQCKARSKRSGARCKRTTCLGLPFCWSHAKTEMHLLITKSRVPGAGKGVRAYGGTKASRRETVVFRKGDTIASYDGQLIRPTWLAQRYDWGGHDVTGPYAISGNSKQRIWDAACRRTIASLFNSTRTKSAANAHVVPHRPDRNGRPVPPTVVAKRVIYHDDEIRLYYGKDYWAGHKYISTHTTRRKSGTCGIRRA